MLSSLICAVSICVVYGVSPCDLLTSQSYPCENHTVTTVDGFFLNAQRIPPKTANSSVVLLLHGLEDSSATWISQLPNESLGFILHDSGFDVWLVNARGNIFSQEHAHLNPSDDSYWQSIDWDQMAYYDLPAFVGYVMERYSPNRKVAVVAHSQGGLTAITSLASVSNNTASAQTNLSSISLVVALAPAVYMSNMRAEVLRTIADLDIANLLSLLGGEEFPDLTTRELVHLLGVQCPRDPNLCDDFLYVIAGYNPNNINGTRLKEQMPYVPASTSVYNLIHWAQMIKNTKDVAMHDWGYLENKIKYGQWTPPLYNLSLYNVPTAIYYGDADLLADSQDVLQLISALPTSTVITYESIAGYEHLDFVWGLDAAIKVYPKVLDILRRNA